MHPIIFTVPPQNQIDKIDTRPQNLENGYWNNVNKYGKCVISRDQIGGGRKETFRLSI